MEYHYGLAHLFFEDKKAHNLNHSFQKISCVLLMTLRRVHVWLHQRVREPQSLLHVRQ